VRWRNKQHELPILRPDHKILHQLAKFQLQPSVPIPKFAKIGGTL